MHSPAPPDPRTARRVGAIALGLALAWSVLIANVVYPMLPYSAVDMPTSRAIKPTLWAPQGWAFFTKDPREQRAFLYQRLHGRWTDLKKAPHAEPRNAFGLNRASRAQGVELALLMQSVPAAAWRDCNGDPRACFSSAATAPAVRNVSPRPTVCGTVALVFQAPVPWAWAGSRRPVHMPSRYAVVEASC